MQRSLPPLARSWPVSAAHSGGTAWSKPAETRPDTKLGKYLTRLGQPRSSVTAGSAASTRSGACEMANATNMQSATNWMAKRTAWPSSQRGSADAALAGATSQKSTTGNASNSATAASSVSQNARRRRRTSQAKTPVATMAAGSRAPRRSEDPSKRTKSLHGTRGQRAKAGAPS